MTTRPKPARGVLLALAALALLSALLWWRTRPHDLPLPATSASMARVPSTASTVATPQVEPTADMAAHASPGRDVAPLPPAGTPLAAMQSELERRADAGDAHAACRLSVELIRCRLALSMMESVAQGMRDGESKGAPLQGEVLEAMDRQSRIAAQCGGLDSKAMAQAPRWLRQAAEAGEIDAAILYAEGAGFDSGNSYRMLTDPGFDAWRRESPAMVRRALERGSPEAVLLLFVAYSGDQSPFAGLLTDDPVQTEAYSLLASLLRGQADTSRLPLLSETQHQAALQQARRMFRDYFGSRTYADPGRFFRAQRQISPLDAPSTADHAACDPDP